MKLETRVIRYPPETDPGFSLQEALARRKNMQGSMMTGTAALNMLLGAALVAIGVLASALADRVRGVRLERQAPARGRVTAIVEPLPKPVAPKPRAESKDDGATDVIAALVAAGYKKTTAAEAAWACGQSERATVENWTRAALRRCCSQGALA